MQILIRIGVVCFLFFSLLMFSGCYNKDQKLSHADKNIIKFKKDMFSHYGDMLESVTATYDKAQTWHGRDGFTFSGFYSLKNNPLRFEYSTDYYEFTDPVTLENIPPVDLENVATYDAHLDRALFHQDIGGLERFRLLAEAFNKDYASEPTMAYYPYDPYDDRFSYGFESPQAMKAIREAIGEKPKSRDLVLVYKYDSYRSPMGQGMPIAIYGWNESSSEWVRIYSGPFD